MSYENTPHVERVLEYIKKARRELFRVGSEGIIAGISLGGQMGIFFVK